MTGSRFEIPWVAEYIPEGTRAVAYELDENGTRTGNFAYPTHEEYVLGMKNIIAKIAIEKSNEGENDE